MMQSLNGTELHSTPVQHKWDLELCRFAEQQLYTAVVSDAMDQIGVRNQAMREYLQARPRPAGIRRLGADDRVLGRPLHTG